MGGLLYLLTGDEVVCAGPETVGPGVRGQTSFNRRRTAMIGTKAIKTHHPDLSCQRLICSKTWPTKLHKHRDNAADSVWHRSRRRSVNCKYQHALNPERRAVQSDRLATNTTR